MCFSTVADVFSNSGTKIWYFFNTNLDTIILREYAWPLKEAS